MNTIGINLGPLVTRCITVIVVNVCIFFTAYSSAVTIHIEDHKGQPLDEAVVTFKPIDQPINDRLIDSTIIDQINKEFVPEVSVVQTGTAIQFPNNDNILHHVYSFSKSKVFDLPLYQGTPSEPITFDTPGLVTLGCNIHDWMRAYVVVVDTPYYKISDLNGSVELTTIPNGEYELEVWHPRQRNAYKDIINVSPSLELNVTIATKPQLRSRRHSSGRRKQYEN